MNQQAQALLSQLQMPVTDATETAAENAAIALGKLGDAGLPAIQILRASSNTDERFWAVRALWANAAPAAIDILLQLLTDVDEMIRSAAALALGEMHAENAIEPLVTMLTTDTGSAGDHAADALSKIGLAAETPLIKALSHSQRWVRVRAAKALVPIESHAAIAPLINRLDHDESYLVRHYADVALKRMGVGEMIYFK